ncbi:50S ribosomal protein L18 [Candidatus Woesearchaeota archaeon]|nr:50S ribosomal protein L18 [Candidatus Woesearchaeota archaeon]
MKKTKHTVRFRRKEKTNYKKRLKILMARKTRLVVRKSLKNITIQMIKYEPEGDKVLISVNSKKLGDFGWKFSKKNISSAYLAGLFAGIKSMEKGINEAVLDMGLHSPVKKSKIYAALKGVIDAGVKVASSEEVFPSEDRIKGKHISDYHKIKDFEKIFETTKNKILNGSGKPKVSGTLKNEAVLEGAK